MKTPKHTPARVARPYVLGVRVSNEEREEIVGLAKSMRIGVSGLLRYAFSLAREQIAKAGVAN